MPACRPGGRQGPSPHVPALIRCSPAQARGAAHRGPEAPRPFLDRDHGHLPGSGPEGCGGVPQEGAVVGAWGKGGGHGQSDGADDEDPGGS